VKGRPRRSCPDWPVARRPARIRTRYGRYPEETNRSGSSRSSRPPKTDADRECVKEYVVGSVLGAGEVREREALPGETTSNLAGGGSVYKRVWEGTYHPGSKGCDYP